MRSATSSTDRCRTALAALLVSGALALGACASVSFEEQEDRVPLNPQQVSSFGGFNSGTVVWGGVVLGREEFGSVTRLQILSYPLDTRNRPRTDQRDGGWFVVDTTLAADEARFPLGSELTTAGTLQGLVQGELDGLTVQVPRIVSGQLHGW